MSGLTSARGPTRLKKLWKTDIGDHVISLKWSPSDGLLAAASVSGPIQLFSPDGKPHCTFSGHAFGTTALSWHHRGSLLASAGQDGKVRLWDTSIKGEKAVLPGGNAWVEHVSWHPSEDILISAAGKKMRQWSADGSLVLEFMDHPATIADLAWRPGTQQLTSATYGGVGLWNLGSGEPIEKLAWGGSVLKLAWSPDGAYLAHGNQDSSVHYWVMESGDDLEMPGYPLKVREICWDATGRYLATGGGDQVTVWDCAPPGPAGTTPLSFAGHEGPITALEYQRRGPLLASGGEDGKVYLFQPGKYKKFVVESEVGSPVACLAWSADERLLAVGTQLGTVQVYSVG